MSTYIYLRCEDHNPPLRAEHESAQHIYRLPEVRAALADRERISKDPMLVNGFSGTGHFEANTAQFLAAHPLCRIGIEDEYGREYPLEEPRDD